MTTYPSTEPFMLPSMALPTTARLSPHRTRAQEESIEWAHRVGLLGGSVWTEDDLRGHDYALMCAYIHPSADATELTLITQWYTWVFFFDDEFLVRFKRTGDREGAIAYVDRLTTVLATVQPTVFAAIPAEVALADLWARTASAMSEVWRARFTAVTTDLLTESLAELDSITARRVPDPIEYIELRRRVGGAPWSATLVEHTVGEIPPRLVGTRPLRVVTDTFADAVHLRNDLFSYQREIQQEDEPHNAVLVAERFLGYSTQQAADLVAELVASRLRLLEHAATDEMAELFTELDATAVEREQVRAYVQGLRDWQSGGHEWHSRSSRYMNTAVRGRAVQAAPVAAGPGTSLARPVRPLPAPGVTRDPTRQTTDSWKPVLPPMPFPVRTSPHLDRVREHAVRWARDLLLFEPVLGVARSHIWTEQDFVDLDLPLCACSVFPDADVEYLKLVTYWLHMTYLDDYIPAVYGHADRAVATAFIADLIAMIVPATQRPPPQFTPQRLLAELWDTTTRHLPPSQWQPMRRALVAWLRSNLWEHRYAHTAAPPDPVDYLEMARVTFGAEFMFAMIHARHPAIPAEIYASTPMVVLDNIVSDLFRLTNDLVSYHKEVVVEGELLNAVSVFQRFLRTATAGQFVQRLLSSRLRQLQRTIEHDLPAFYRRRGLPADVVAEIESYVATLRSWVSGIDNWHRRTPRYTPAHIEARYRRLRDRALAGPNTLVRSTR